MGVFGRRTARERLRRATRDALSVPTFRTPDDCTPWVLGGLWPAELSQVTAQTASTAEYLKRDLQRIADSANHRLREIADAGLPENQHTTEQNRVIDAARAFAVQRVESTVRQLRREAPAPEILPAALDEPTEVITVGEPTRMPASQTSADEVIPQPSTESDEQRLRRLVEGFARQEPGLRWAAGLRADGTTVVVTDLAHGWIPPGVVLPSGVDLLAPGRRAGGVKALLGANEKSAQYTPGDPFDRGAAAPRADRGARDAPVVDDLGWQLAEATRWRDGLPRITHTLAKAAASGTGVVDAELDVLRVHLDTARYHLVARYPGLDAPLLLNCLLLAATDALATGSMDAANYHFAWFQALSAQ